MRRCSGWTKRARSSQSLAISPLIVLDILPFRDRQDCELLSGMRLTPDEVTWVRSAASPPFSPLMCEGLLSALGFTGDTDREGPLSTPSGPPERVPSVRVDPLDGFGTVTIAAATNLRVL
jgi:hypothetical protein